MALASLPSGCKEWPKIVVMMLTWCGPPERNQRDIRLEYTKKTIASLRRHLIYPRKWIWHIADDGSDREFQQEIIAMLKGDAYTLTDTKAMGDIGLNLNMGQEVAFLLSDVVVFWQDDRWLQRDLDVAACVKLLMEHKDIGLIRLKPHQSNMEGERAWLSGADWWKIDKLSPCAHTCTLGPNIRHKRFVEHYGAYKTGLAVESVENEMSYRFRRISGPGVVCPSERWSSVEIPWGTYSTWESK